MTDALGEYIAALEPLARRLGLLTETDLRRMQALHAEVRAAIDASC